jgi:hypothetical protein
MRTPIAPQDMLEDLQRLSEAGRERYLRMLPPEDMVEALTLALRGRENLPISEDPMIDCAQRLNKARVPAKYQTVVTKRRPHSPTVEIVKKKARRGSVGTHRPLRIESCRKVREMDTVAKTNEFGSDSDEVCFWKSRVQKSQRERDIGIESASDDELGQERVESKEVEGERPIRRQIAKGSKIILSKDRQRKRRTLNLPNHIPIVLLIPDRKLDTRFQSIDNVPTHLRNQLLELYHKMHSASTTRKKGYDRVAKAPDRYLGMRSCLRDHISSANGYRIGEGEKLKQEADHRCIRAQSPCMHLLMHNEITTLCIVPLPKELRVEKTWKDLGFWVRE